MFFGRKNPEGKTILVLDVEQGSAASALVRLSPEAPPKIFGERRVHLPVPATHDFNALAYKIEQAAQTAFLHGVEVASRLRNAAARFAGASARRAGQARICEIGTIERVAIFLAPPWGVPNIARGEPEFLRETAESLRDLARAHVGTRHTLHTHAEAALYAARAILPGDQLLCSIGGEITELLHVKDGTAAAHALVPQGVRSLLRTLRAHAGLSLHEAESALRLEPAHLGEPLGAAYGRLAAALAEAVRGLRNPPRAFCVISHEPGGERFARALAAEREFSTLFPEGSTSRALRTREVAPYFAAHAASPDLWLMLEALYLAGNI